MSLELWVNGQRLCVSGADLHQPLLHFLRARGLTGTKEGCAEGECGACAVVLVRSDADGTARFEPVNSCLLLLGSAVGQEIVTVEGVAQDGNLHPVQQSMAELGGSQCGYCTPGFVMSMFAEYYRKQRDAYDPEAISGNLCRCTGYRPIRDAAREMGTPRPDDPHLRRLQLAPPQLAPVADPRFVRPTHLAEALDLLRQNPNASIVAGGTDIAVDINQRAATHDLLISLENVAELQELSFRDNCLRIGAGVSLSEVERRVHDRVPMLQQLFPLFSSRLIRNRATLGGNLGTASPIGDSPPALLALDAELDLASAAGTRTVALSDFFLGYRKTALKPGEIIACVSIPLPLPQLQRFYKVSKRVLDDISTVAAGFSLRLDAQGRITSARLCYGGVAATPVRALEAEKALLGMTWSAAACSGARPLLEQAFSPMSDHRGSAKYRRAMITRLFDKFLHETSAPALATGASV
ncbi:MAG TPA: FAD binding domain-containing protein [Polyangiaceae bacterium]|nr:FAD binding domain-containing protein [Polyangiaceae bacterium]